MQNISNNQKGKNQNKFIIILFFIFTFFTFLIILIIWKLRNLEKPGEIFDKQYKNQEKTGNQEKNLKNQEKTGKQEV